MYSNRFSRLTFLSQVNITSRHESTGEADRIHASEAFVKELDSEFGNDAFNFTERGKGTYWNPRS